MATPRYISLNDVKNYTLGKVVYASNLPTVLINPGPSSVVAGTGTSYVLTWSSMPSNWSQLLQAPAGVFVQNQTLPAPVTVSGSYSLIPGTLYSMVVDNLQGGIPIITTAMSFYTEPNAITDDFLSQIIARAEADVERELSPLYIVPIVTSDSPPQAFEYLPASSLYYLQDLFVLFACIKLEDVLYNRSGGNRGDGGLANLKGEYGHKLSKLLGKDSTGKFLYPPLPGVLVNEDSFKYNAYLPAPASINGGAVYNSANYANSRVNDPSRNLFYWRRPRTRVCVTKTN